MTSWSYDQFVKFVESQKLETSYLFLGKEVYLIEEALKKLKAHIFSQGGEDFNLDIFDSTHVDLDHVLQSLETLPMMGNKRLVILKRCHELSSQQLSMILDSLSIPIETSVFVMIFESLDQRKKASKDLIKKTTVVDFSSPHEKTIPSWIQRLAQEEGKKISLKNAFVLKESVGNYLLDLRNEIQKLSSYIGEREEIKSEDIEKIVSKTKIESIFELTRAIGEKRLEMAIRIQKELLDQGESEVGILAMITRHIRLLLLTQEALIKRMPDRSVSGYIGVPPFFINSYIEQSKLFSREKLISTHRELLKTDRFLKSSSIPGEIYLYHLLENTLCRDQA